MCKTRSVTSLELIKEEASLCFSSANVFSTAMYLCMLVVCAEKGVCCVKSVWICNANVGVERSLCHALWGMLMVSLLWLWTTEGQCMIWLPLLLPSECVIQLTQTTLLLIRKLTAACGSVEANDRTVQLHNESYFNCKHDFQFPQLIKYNQLSYWQVLHIYVLTVWTNFNEQFPASCFSNIGISSQERPDLR